MTGGASSIEAELWSLAIRSSESRSLPERRPRLWPGPETLSGAAANASLRCGECRICCTLPGLIVNVWPDHGDDAASFETYTVTVPGKEPEIFVKKTAAGACVYLGPDGCTIYERRPVVCQDFDCRRWPNAWSRGNLERPTSRALIVAGLEQQRRSRQALAARFNAALRP